MEDAPLPPNLPRAPACDRNRDPILTALREVLSEPATVLEIGSGTGEHAVYFARHMPWLRWQPSERPEALEGVAAWVEWAGLPNLCPPLALDVLAAWPDVTPAAAFSANTAHIMPWRAVEATFAGLARLLPRAGPFALYGPFNYGGDFTSDSNREFDAMLRRRDPSMGLRDLDELVRLAERVDFELEADHAMPANNRLLVWRRL